MNESKQPQGKLITIEGIEGVGKSTAVAFIADYIKQAGINIQSVREPGGTAIAEIIRTQLLKPKFEESLTPIAELLLLFAGRAQNMAHNIKPALETGQWVLCDRFIDATYAYQSGGRQLQSEWIDTLAQWVKQATPDLVILLDLTVEQSKARVLSRQEPTDRFEIESDAFFERVRASYLARAKAAPNRYAIIDANQALPAVQADIKSALDQLIQESGGQ